MIRAPASAVAALAQVMLEPARMGFLQACELAVRLQVIPIRQIADQVVVACSGDLGEEDLTELMTREMGKVKAEAGGDVQEAIDMTFYMAGEGRRLFGQTTPSGLPPERRG